MPEKELPALPPEMLLSASACRELEAAQQSYDMPAQRAPRPMRERQASSAAQYRSQVAGAEAEPGYFDLEALDATPPQDTGMDITFDSGEGDIEFDTVPERHASGGGVGGGRFNVLRPPVHEPFRSVVASGPQGGQMREVGRVGRFPLLTDAPITEFAAPRVQARPPGGGMTPQEGVQQLREALSPGRQRLYEVRAVIAANRAEIAASARTSAQYNALQAEKTIAARAAIHHTLPTAYDRLLGEDLYDDDLE